MANRNQRGPQEMGPMTGRGMGRCGGQNNTETQTETGRGRGGRGMGKGRGQGGGMGNGQGQGRGQGGQGMGRGFGQGQGRRQGAGRGFGARFQDTDEPTNLAQEVSALRAELAALRNSLNNTNDSGEDQ